MIPNMKWWGSIVVFGGLEKKIPGQSIFSLVVRRVKTNISTGKAHIKAEWTAVVWDSCHLKHITSF